MTCKIKKAKQIMNFQSFTTLHWPLMPEASIHHDRFYILKLTWGPIEKIGEDGG